MQFKFLVVGSAQNVSLVNTVLATICAEKFKELADKMEGGSDAASVVREALNQHWRVIFNGNGYAGEWPAEAEQRGLFNIPSGVDATNMLGSDKNVALFEVIQGIMMC